MDTLPAEIVWQIVHHTDPTTRAVVACVRDDWKDVAKAVNDRHLQGEGKIRSCRTRNKKDGTASACLMPRRCAIRYAQHALRQGRRKVADWMIGRTGPMERGNDSDLVACNVAAAEGDLVRLADLVATRGYRLDPDEASRQAAQNGHLDVLEWIADRRDAWSIRACDRAIEAGYLALGDRIMDKHKAIFVSSGDAPWTAARHGHLCVLQKLAKWVAASLNDTRWAIEAAKGDRTDILEWLGKRHQCSRVLWYRKDHECLYRDVARCAAMGGHLTAFNWAVKHNGGPTTTELGIALRHGHLNVVQRIWPVSGHVAEDVCALAAKGGHLDVIVWLCEHGRSPSKRMVIKAASGGHLHILQWCAERGLSPCPRAVFNKAITRGHLRVVEWITRWSADFRDHIYGICTAIGVAPDGALDSMRLDASALFDAVKRGHIDVLEWLDAHEFDCSTLYNGAMCEVAARNGHLCALDWLLSKGYKWNKQRCCIAAALSGDVDMLKWLAVQGCVYDAHVVAHAVASEFYSIVPWLRAHGAPWDADVSAEVARLVNAKALEWTRAQGCPWDARTCAILAGSGSLDILQLARRRGCPWDADTATEAARAGKWETLAWAVQMGCPWDIRTLQALGLGNSKHPIGIKRLVHEARTRAQRQHRQ